MPLAFNPINAQDWITALGGFAVLGICLIIFAETGLLIGFFMPGDSLLFLAGVMTLGGKTTSSGKVLPHLSLAVLLVAVPICAVAGAQLGHYLGARFGRPMFDKPDSRFFKRAHVDRAEEVFNKYGPAKAVILARFIPVVRTFMNPVAGVLEMPARKFLVYNIIGGVLWSDGVLLLGRALSNSLTPDEIDKYIIPITLVIVAVSLIPVFLEVLKARKEKKNGGHGGPSDSYGDDQQASASGGRHRTR
jgi:membrane-associated protein